MVLIPFDRSRREDDERCRRLRFWRYEWQGKGLEQRGLNQHLAFGSAVHTALAYILDGVRVDDDLPPDVIVSNGVLKASTEFRKVIIERGFQLEQEQGYAQDPYSGELVTIPQADNSWLLDHYCDLLEALVRGWCMVRLPLLLADYRVLAVETEKQLLIPLTEELLIPPFVLIPQAAGYSYALLFLSRPDAVLERRSDGGLVVLNFKTVGEPKKWWLDQWATDQQTISEVLPIEHEYGREVKGVLIEGLVKGPQRVEYPRNSGHWHHTSPIIWGWQRDGDGFTDTEWAGKYEWRDDAGNSRRLGKGWNRQRIADTYPGGISQWLRFLASREPALLNSQFVNPPLISRSAQDIEEWQQQVKHRELEIWEARADASIDMAKVFPKSTGSAKCVFPGRCPAYDLCWGSAGEDPLGSGLYQIRTPNHPE